MLNIEVYSKQIRYKLSTLVAVMHSVCQCINICKDSLGLIPTRKDLTESHFFFFVAIDHYDLGVSGGILVFQDLQGFPYRVSVLVLNED